MDAQRGIERRRLALVVVGGYVLGSIPVAVVAGRRSGLDPRRSGDRNPGFWNTRALLGTRQALPVFAGDMLKGTAAGCAGRGAGGGAYTYAGVAAAMLGHSLPALSGFRGGRGVLTYVGGLAAISPPTFVLSWAVCGAVTAATGSFAQGARTGVFASPAIQLLVERNPYRVAATGGLMTLIGVRFAQAAIVGRAGRTSGPASSGAGGSRPS